MKMVHFSKISNHCTLNYESKVLFPTSFCVSCNMCEQKHVEPVGYHRPSQREEIGFNTLAYQAVVSLTLLLPPDGQELIILYQQDDVQSRE